MGVTSQPSLPLHCGSLCPRTSPNPSPWQCLCLSHPHSHLHLREMPPWEPFSGVRPFVPKSYRNAPYKTQCVSSAPAVKPLLHLHAVPQTSGQFIVFFQNVAPRRPGSLRDPRAGLCTRPWLRGLAHLPPTRSPHPPFPGPRLSLFPCSSPCIRGYIFFSVNHFPSVEAQ